MLSTSVTQLEQGESDTFNPLCPAFGFYSMSIAFITNPDPTKKLRKVPHISKIFMFHEGNQLD